MIIWHDYFMLEFVLFLDQDLVVEKMVTPDNIMNVVVTLYVYFTSLH